MTTLSPALTPRGRLHLTKLADAPALDSAVTQRLTAAFARGAGHGLLQLGAAEVDSALPPAFSYLRELAQRYVTNVCTLPDDGDHGLTFDIAPPSSDELSQLANAVPPIPGAEYISADVLLSLWRELEAAFGAEFAESKQSREEFLKHKSPAWNLVGRVHFNLAENRKDDSAPFAFLATYLVARFQEDDSIPFFVLSLKAGGSGLNLTAASHVIHFDRWWNPAVENQATDRAFRIGQTKNVLVHKFVCRGTVEDKIDQLMAWSSARKGAT